MLIGKWDEAMYYVLGDPTTKPKGYDPMTEAALLWERDNHLPKTRYNLSPFAISLNEILPGLLEKLPPTDSRLRPDQRHLENGEYELANAEKLRLEQLQRQVNYPQLSTFDPWNLEFIGICCFRMSHFFIFVTLSSSVSNYKTLSMNLCLFHGSGKKDARKRMATKMV